MKFLNRLDLELFLSEVDRLDLLGQVDENYQPPDELLELFIKRRKPLTGAIKSFRRSQNTKEQWRKNRWKFMQGIKRFHSSTQGKRFHRNLGRFLSSRYFNPTLRSIVSQDREQDDKESRHVKEELSVYDLAEIIKALLSCKTHALIELEYFLPLEEEVSYWELLDVLLPGIDKIEKSLWLGHRLNEDDLELIFRLTNEKELVKSFAEACKVDVKFMEDVWNEFKNNNEERMGENLYVDWVEFVYNKLDGSTRKIMNEQDKS